MAEAQQNAPQGPVFTIDKIYVKDLSLENPGAPKSFLTQEAPQVEVGLRTRGEQVEPDIYECVLTVTLTAKAGESVFGHGVADAEHLRPYAVGGEALQE